MGKRSNNKVDVCHDQVDGSYKLLSVGQPALEAHLRNHDDAVPGGTTSLSGTQLDFACIPLPPTPPVLITTDRDGNREIYAMNPDGSDAVNLSLHPASDDEPDWTPDGSQIVFTSERDGQTDIYMMAQDGGSVTRLTNTPERERSPDVSPDGTKILFDIFRSNRTGNIYVMNIDGSSLQQLTNSSQEDRAATWSPDGLTIAFHKSVPGNTDIWLMDHDGSNQRNLTNTPLEFNSEASWVSDGSAFYTAAAPAGNPGTLALYRVEVPGGSLTQLTAQTQSIQNVNPVLSPNESELLFTSNRTGTPQQVFILDLADLSITQVTNPPGFYSSHSWR